MNQRILHTPEGVRDIYPLECRQKFVVQEKLHSTLRSYGYQDIQTPTLEFLEVFGKEVGSLKEKELYRFFDRDGNTIVLRPDITPSIARSIATYADTTTHYSKLCYVGNTFMNHSSYQGRLKENIQIGAEMIGLDSIESDAEMVAMAVAALQAVGVDRFEVSVSHVGYLNALMEAAALDADTEVLVRELCENKNYYGVINVLEQSPIHEKVAEAFRVLPELVGGIEIFARAKEVAPTAQAVATIERLEQIATTLEMYGVLQHITFDLSMTGAYGYYTGIIFRGYTFGTGDAVVKGGRYNELLQHFGKHTPAIGFAIYVEELFHAILRQEKSMTVPLDNHIILYEAKMQERAIRLAAAFRANGRVTEIIKKEEHDVAYYIEYAKKNFAKYMLYLKGTNNVESVNLLTGKQAKIDLSQQL